MERARSTLAIADEEGSVDLRVFGAQLAVIYCDRALPRESGFRLMASGEEIKLAPDTPVITRERYAVTATIEHYLRLIGEKHWRVGGEIASPSVIRLQDELWHTDGKHRLLAARLLGLTVPAGIDN